MQLVSPSGSQHLYLVNIQHVKFLWLRLVQSVIVFRNILNVCMYSFTRRVPTDEKSKPVRAHTHTYTHTNTHTHTIVKKRRSLRREKMCLQSRSEARCRAWHCFHTYLFLHCVLALLRQVHHVDDDGSQVAEGGDGLHLNRVHLLHWVIQDTRCVHHLRDRPSQQLYVTTTSQWSHKI